MNKKKITNLCSYRESKIVVAEGEANFGWRDALLAAPLIQLKSMAPENTVLMQPNGCSLCTKALDYTIFLIMVLVRCRPSLSLT